MTLRVAVARRMFVPAPVARWSEAALISAQPQHMQAILGGGRDRRAGRIRAWREVKQQLG